MILRLEQLSERSFEDLVHRICCHLLGPTTERFTSGPDGGRDARYRGQAAGISEWKGTIIVQAKHVQSPTASFSDKDFFSGQKSCLMRKEAPKVKKLIEDGALEYYILFSNRRKTANNTEKIIEYLSSFSGLEKTKIKMVGLEEMESLIRYYNVSLDGIDFPDYNRAFYVSPDEIEHVLDALSGWISLESTVAKVDEIRRISFAKKNKLNGVNSEQAKRIYRKAAPHDEVIRNFLAHPSNGKIQEKYTIAAEEFQRKILNHDDKNAFCFFSYYNYILDCLYDYSSYLRVNKPLTEVIVGYMYFNCDIGRCDET